MAEKKLSSSQKGFVSPEIFGGARFIDILKQRKREDDELFFTVKRREPGKEDQPVYPLEGHSYGYMKITDPVRKIIMNDLIHDTNASYSIAFIEWEDSFNVVFKCSKYLASSFYRMEKEDFAAFEKSIKPVNK